jgi:hypothetical protein
MAERAAEEKQEDCGQQVLLPENMDKDMHGTREAMFRHQSSGLFKGGDEKCKEKEEYFESPKENYSIVFRNANVLSNIFYSNLTDEIKDDDFTAIYVPLRSDSLSVETVCGIAQYLNESDNKTAEIFVRVNEKSALTTTADKKFNIFYTQYNTKIARQSEKTTEVSLKTK